MDRSDETLEKLRELARGEPDAVRAVAEKAGDELRDLLEQVLEEESTD